MDSQRIDGFIGRMVHGLTSAAPAASQSEEDAVLASVDYYLAAGRELKRWFDRADASQSYREKFELTRTFNRPELSYGFFDEIPLFGSTMPVMGNVQDMFYDQPRVPAGLRQPATEWLRAQIREFVLHFFMRVSDFRDPEVYVPSDRTAPPGTLRAISWCPKEEIRREGFGFSQIFYKLAGTGEIGRFPEERQFEIVDLREIGPKYEWIVVKVRIFDFSFKFKPAGPDGPELVFALNEESYLVLSAEFIADEDHPEPGVLGRYTLGYSFIKSPNRGAIAYGPGQFEAAFESIQFRILDNGEIYVRMIFVVNQPVNIALLEIDPIGWSWRLADVASLGVSSRLLGPFKDTLSAVWPRFGAFDPVFTYIRLANAATAGWAAGGLCISRQSIFKDFLIQHHKQHFAAVSGSLLTWRQICDWLDRGSIPDWVVAGVSS